MATRTHLARDAEIAYREYREARELPVGRQLSWWAPLRALRNWVSHAIFRKPTFRTTRSGAEVEKLEFLGVWDTVGAYGGPIDEITRAIDYWYWPLSMPDQFMSTRSSGPAMRWRWRRSAMLFIRCFGTIVMFAPTTGSTRGRSRLEAGAIGPRRSRWPRSTANASARFGSSAFTPTSAAAIRGTDLPIALPGMDDGPGQVYGLQYLPAQKSWLASFLNPKDKLNDLRHGLAGYYRYRPRKLVELYK